MAYTKLSEAAQARVRATLVHTQGGQVSDKLRRVLEEDHYARTVLGWPAEPVEQRVAEMKRPVTPPANPGGGPPVTPPGPPANPGGGGPPNK